MALRTTGRLATWGFVVVSCALGCATGTQSNGQLTDPINEGGSGGSAGTTDAAAGSEAASGTGGASAGFTSGGTFVTGGTGGTPTTSGAAGGAGAGTPGGGAAGASGSGGAAAGSGGKAGGGAGGAAGTGGKAGTTPCTSAKLTITSATGTEENATLSPKFAIDGDMATRWASEKSEPQALDLDMGEVVTVNRVLIDWEAAYAAKYELQIATTAAGPFTTIYTDSAGNGGTDDVTTLTASDGRYLRMQGITRGTAYGFSIYEIAVYGDKDETCQ